MNNWISRIAFWVILTACVAIPSYVILEAANALGNTVLAVSGASLVFFLTSRPGGWIRANMWLAVAVVSAWVSVMSWMFWIIIHSTLMGWLAIIALVVAIICFIRHMCLMRNWCQQLNAWWAATAWPAIRATVTRFTAWLRGPFLRGVNAVAQTIWNALSFIAQNIRIAHVQWILLLVSGYGLYHSIFQGPLWISVWWWAALFTFAILWLFAEARAMVRAVVQRLWRAHVANWNRIPGFWQFILTALAVGWICLCFWLLSLWKHGELFAGHNVDLIGVGGVFLAGIGIGWVLCSVMAGHGPRPPVLPQVNRRGRRAGANP